MQSAHFAKTKVPTAIVISALIVAALMSILVLFTPAPKADALSTYVWDNRKTVGVVPLEYGPTDAGNPYYWMVEGTRFQMKCYIDFKGITGNYYSKRWFRGIEYSRGSWGYVHSSYVINQTSVPRCS